MTPLRVWTHLLLDPNRAHRAIDALAGVRALAAWEGLCDLLEAPPSAGLAVAAVGALAPSNDVPMVREALLSALDLPMISARIAAVEALSSAPDPVAVARWTRALREDPAWTVRRAVIAALIPTKGALPTFLSALDDPHWRVRQDALRPIIEAGRQDAGFRARCLERSRSGDVRSRAALCYAAFCWGETAEPPEAPVPERPAWWDDDPPVLRRRVQALDADALARDARFIPALLGDADPGVRRAAERHLRRSASTETLRRALRLMDDPRRPFVVHHVEALLARLNLDREEALARAILSTPDTHSPSERAFALSQLDEALPIALLTEAEQACADRFRAARPVQSPKSEPPPGDRRARAASLTVEAARALWQNPETETSWRVLKRASVLLRRRLRDIAPPEPPPAERRPALSTEPPPEGLAIESGLRRSLGGTDLSVSPLGLSGHYNLEARGYWRALDAGVNLVFWEPEYTVQTRAMLDLPKKLRGELVVTCGSFEATPKAIRKDIERALRHLRIDAVTVFLVFWTRSWDRLSDDVVAGLEEARSSGLIRHWGMSTHQPALATRALRQGLGPVMVRHSAAHRSMEREAMPLAAELGSGLLTFNALSYGRLLIDPLHQGVAPPMAADCYRYAMRRPGVASVFSAPSTLAQLDANLKALSDPALSEQAQARLRTFGDRVGGVNRAFARWVRWL